MQKNPLNLTKKIKSIPVNFFFLKLFEQKTLTILYDLVAVIDCRLPWKYSLGRWSKGDYCFHMIYARVGMLDRHGKVLIQGNHLWPLKSGALPLQRITDDNSGNLFWLAYDHWWCFDSEQAFQFFFWRFVWFASVVLFGWIVEANENHFRYFEDHCRWFC